MSQETATVDYLTPDERETTLTMSDGDDHVRINTAQRTMITALRKKPAFTEVATGFHGTTEWAEFTIPKARFNLAKAAKIAQNLTSEQRESRRANMARLHANRAATIAKGNKE